MLPSRRCVRSRKDDGNKKEEIKEMVGGNSSSRSAAESIPDELLFEILVRLPAQDIYHGARLVCKKWYNTTRTKYFIKTHLEHASYGLFYRDESGDFVFTSARKTGGGIDTSKFNYRIKDRETTWSCCNGLMLECKHSFRKLNCYVTHVSTNQVFRLPPFPSPSRPRYFSNSCGIGYDAVSMTCKVVVSDNDVVYGYVCFILTVGIDKTWRRVCIDHLSNLGKQTILLCRPPIFTEGFLHWKSFSDTKVVTLNLETEIITETHPHIPKVKEIKRRILSTGSCLSLLIQREKLVWEVFEMKSNTGEWRKLPNICLEGQKGRIIERLGINFSFDDAFDPWGWLKYPEVLALRIKLAIIYYNLITFEVGTEKVPLFRGYNVLHKNGLVWLGGP